MTDPYRPIDWTPPASPPPGEWQEIGQLSVDSGQLLLVDPCYLPSIDLKAVTTALAESGVLVDPAGPLATIVVPGYGDGRYPVYGRFVDDVGGGLRLAEVRIVFIDE